MGDFKIKLRDPHPHDERNCNDTNKIGEIEIMPTQEFPFLVRADIHPYFMMFECFDAVIVGNPISNECEILYAKDGGSFDYEDAVENHENAQIFMDGSIKWDGCSNIRFYSPGEAEGTFYQHFCGMYMVRNLFRLIEKCYRLASENIPHWDVSNKL